MRSRSWLMALLLLAFAGWVVWTRWELAGQRERVEQLRQDIQRIDELQKYLPSLVRTVVAEHERRMLVVIREMGHDGQTEGDGR